MLKLFQDVRIYKQQYKLFHIGKDRVHSFMPSGGGTTLELRYDQVLRMQCDCDLVEIHRAPPHAALHKPKSKLKKAKKWPSRKDRSEKRRAK